MNDESTWEQLKPRPKVVGATVGAAFAAVIVGTVEALTSVSFPTGYEAALATVLAFGVGWWTRDSKRSRDDAPPTG